MATDSALAKVDSFLWGSRADENEFLGRRPRQRGYTDACPAWSGGSWVGGEGHLSDLSVGDPPLLLVVPDRLGVLDRHPVLVVSRGDRPPHGRIHAGGDREPGTTGAGRGDDVVVVVRGLCRCPGYADLGCEAPGGGRRHRDEVGIITDSPGMQGAGRRGGIDRHGCPWVWCHKDAGQRSTARLCRGPALPTHRRAHHAH